jgi:glycosyl transferase family 25
MRIILINLARATDRRAKMQAQFAALNLPFEILEATDGRKITDKERNLVDNNLRRRISPYPLTDNEIGCWLSHRRAIESVAKGTENMAAIVEDDTAIFPDFGKVCNAIENKGGTFDFIFLHRQFKRNEVFVPCRRILPENQIGRVGPMSMGCHTYIVSRDGAAKFLARGNRFAHAVDKEIHRYWVSRLNIFGLENPVAKHADEGHSYIDETRGHDRPKVRERYPDSDAWIWRWHRSMTKLQDSINKRLSFPAYVRSGKQA